MWLAARFDLLSQRFHLKGDHRPAGRLTAIFVAGLVVSLAVAAPPPGKGKGKAAETGAACKPVVTFLLKGEYVAGSADAEGRHDHHAQLWVRAPNGEFTFRGTHREDGG